MTDFQNSNGICSGLIVVMTWHLIHWKSTSGVNKKIENGRKNTIFENIFRSGLNGQLLVHYMKTFVDMIRLLNFIFALYGVSCLMTWSVQLNVDKKVHHWQYLWKKKRRGTRIRGKIFCRSSWTINSRLLLKKYHQFVVQLGVLCLLLLFGFFIQSISN